ncbi:MAG: hypothetical protein KGH61_05295 [Candidatus Micrarchaeota archaeon]|nr:hypothetical protein [Candidatus Micrarchaeota archaeon]MDE1848330.1 hypothetical protein [Candidatus Micrarchaeota archaeon]MDE1864919.1 hypothetical protein [Candidatus Micrarchaeota archaeon]
MTDLVARITMRSRLVAIHEPRRRAKSMDYLKESVARLTKSDVGAIKIDSKLNEFLMMSPARRMKGIEVKITKDANSVKVFLLNPQVQKPQSQMPKPAALPKLGQKKQETNKEAAKEKPAAAGKLPAQAEMKSPKPAAPKAADKGDSGK